MKLRIRTKCIFTMTQILGVLEVGKDKSPIAHFFADPARTEVNLIVTYSPQLIFIFQNQWH